MRTSWRWRRPRRAPISSSRGAETARSTRWRARWCSGDERARQRRRSGIIPGGSGNGLARELGIPFDPAHGDRARGAVARPGVVDAGELGDRVFFNVAGIGLDAHVAALVSTRVHHRGLLPYLKASAGDLLRYRPVEYTVAVDGRTMQTSALVLAFANSKQWGFGAEIAPGARSRGWPARFRGRRKIADSSET